MKLAEKIAAYLRGRERQLREERAFLPAALEIVETPPSPIGRMGGFVIVAFFGLALAWACLGSVDIVASAPGKIIPSARTKVVQPFETGVVKLIQVHDGQVVNAGDVVIELDSTMNEAERDHLQSDFVATRLDSARLRAALTESADPLKVFNPPADASEVLVEMERRFLIEQTTQQRAKLAALESQEAQKLAELASIAATIEKLESIIPLMQERTDMRKILLDHQRESKVTYLETLQTSVEAQKELKVQQSRLKEAEAALVASQETKQQAKAEFRHKLSSDLAEAERKAAGLAHDLAKAEQRTKFQTLVAPVDGVVQQLAIHTVGGVVTPAQVLAVVVPANSRLEIEAMISNRDIGFVHQGQPAQIKVDTFNFTRYGLLHGEVVNVSQDAIIKDKPQELHGSAPQLGTADETSEPKGQELLYAARVSLEKTQMQVEDRLVNLTPGMAVTVEIKTGTRRIISYLLSPILRYAQESLRER